MHGGGRGSDGSVALRTMLPGRAYSDAEVRNGRSLSKCLAAIPASVRVPRFEGGVHQAVWKPCREIGTGLATRHVIDLVRSCQFGLMPLRPRRDRPSAIHRSSTNARSGCAISAARARRSRTSTILATTGIIPWKSKSGSSSKALPGTRPALTARVPARPRTSAVFQAMRGFWRCPAIPRIPRIGKPGSGAAAISIPSGSTLRPSTAPGFERFAPAATGRPGYDPTDSWPRHAAGVPRRGIRTDRCHGRASSASRRTGMPGSKAAYRLASQGGRALRHRRLVISLPALGCAARRICRGQQIRRMRRYPEGQRGTASDAEIIEYAMISIKYEAVWDVLRCRGRGGMVPRGGIEPPTLRFSVACSTN